MKECESRFALLPHAPRYRRAKEIADRVLIALGTRALPSDPVRVLYAACAHARLIPYTGLARRAGLTIDALSRSLASRAGRIFHNPEAGVLDILYNDTGTHGFIRWTIAHELGHFFLGHTRDFTRDEQDIVVDAAAGLTLYDVLELEAHAFAAELLAPACVLFALNARTPELIRTLCDLSLEASVKRAHFLACIEGCYYLSPVEAEVLRRFQEFIYHHAAC